MVSSTHALLQWFVGLIEWKQGSGLKEKKSCRTRVEFLSIHASVSSRFLRGLGLGLPGQAWAFQDGLSIPRPGLGLPRPGLDPIQGLA